MPANRSDSAADTNKNNNRPSPRGVEAEAEETRDADRRGKLQPPPANPDYDPPDPEDPQRSGT